MPLMGETYMSIAAARVAEMRLLTERIPIITSILHDVANEAYLRGAAEALGIVPPEHPTRIRMAVSHHGSDCSLNHFETPNIIQPEYCRAVVMARVDNIIDKTTKLLVFGDFAESMQEVWFKPKREPKDFPYTDEACYGGGFWDKVTIPGMDEKGLI